jgi:sugar (pentulose or hexulose) kinase
VSDYHNALKMGADPETGQWPAWVEYLADVDFLPELVKPGATLGLLERPRARELGVNPDCLVRAGTTDSIAAFLAAGLDQPGEAVTSLGTTLVLKLLSETRVDDGRHGVYSHWFGRSVARRGRLQRRRRRAAPAFLRRRTADAVRPDQSRDRSSGLDYYPLPRPGERFPVNDPALPPRLEPRPADRAEFLHGLLEGLARIEALGYRRLAELGATPLRRVAGCGGGAGNNGL